jgi:hypothetical protein
VIFRRPCVLERNGGAEAHAADACQVHCGDDGGGDPRHRRRHPGLAVPPPVEARVLRRPRGRGRVQLHGGRRADGRVRPRAALLQLERARQGVVPLDGRRRVVRQRVPRGRHRAGVPAAAGERDAHRRDRAGGARPAAARRVGGRQAGADGREADGGRAHPRQGAVPVRRGEHAEVHGARELPRRGRRLLFADHVPPGVLPRAHLRNSVHAGACSRAWTVCVRNLFRVYIDLFIYEDSFGLD